MAPLSQRVSRVTRVASPMLAPISPRRLPHERRHRYSHEERTATREDHHRSRGGAVDAAAGTAAIGADLADSAEFVDRPDEPGSDEPDSSGDEPVCSDEPGSGHHDDGGSDAERNDVIVGPGSFVEQ